MSPSPARAGVEEGAPSGPGRTHVEHIGDVWVRLVRHGTSTARFWRRRRPVPRRVSLSFLLNPDLRPGSTRAVGPIETFGKISVREIEIFGEGIDPIRRQAVADAIASSHRSNAAMGLFDRARTSKQEEQNASLGAGEELNGSDGGGANGRGRKTREQDLHVGPAVAWKRGATPRKAPRERKKRPRSFAWEGG
eukprot:scaffold310_cov335-Pavlova_lutheri.AAC.30